MEVILLDPVRSGEIYQQSFRGSGLVCRTLSLDVKHHRSVYCQFV